MVLNWILRVGVGVGVTSGTNFFKFGFQIKPDAVGTGVAVALGVAVGLPLTVSSGVGLTVSTGVSEARGEGVVSPFRLEPNRYAPPATMMSKRMKTRDKRMASLEDS